MEETRQRGAGKSWRWSRQQITSGELEELNHVLTAFEVTCEKGTASRAAGFGRYPLSTTGRS
ncbi:hypothetical protein [Dysosmobacter sp.]|uniref:hypothetical protein n=1 Tax=Dysosmobacter sp. TaxID=2591382 RepID=UPI002DB62A2C|nr:hypothetical protein [Dysosmobacter sp.]